MQTFKDSYTLKIKSAPQYLPSKPKLEKFSDACCDSNFVCEFAFPKPKNAPSISAQIPRDSMIALPVPAQFFCPILPIRFWQMPAPWTAVPETAVNEQSNAIFYKDKVWLSDKLRMPSPSADGMQPQNFD